jgi:LPXTG-motif cell wall-anchored protein
MKKLFAFMMILVLCFSLGVTAFAAENTGSITITNATKDDTYSIYKIFDATYSTDASGNADAVSYSITKTNQFFTYMFGADGKAENTYFSYDAVTGAITRKEGTQNGDIISYLTDMVRSEENNFNAVKTETAASKTVVFDDLPYGYYLIDKGNGAAVTIDSNTPDIQVIDKNQIPGSDFSKMIWDEDYVDPETNKKGQWVVNSSANIGDIVNFKVEFEATNYDGEKQIKYYTVADTKGNALWVEFNSVEVWVDGVKLDRGYYYGVDGTSNTGEWKYFGTWTEEEKANPDNAQWYMIHRGFVAFDIVIPWMDDYHFEGTTNDFSLTYGEDAKSIYNSPVKVVVTYNASVEPGATIGNAQSNNLWNTADLSWTSDTTDGPDDPSTTTTTVYALGLEKIDSDTGAHLAGAVFEVYRDEACTEPVYVIPTNIKGVYILDDLNTIVSGELRETSRKKYAAYLEAYLGPDYATTQKNVVTSEINGKLVILGLEAGNYYLKETVAPKGYNKLASTTLVTVGLSNNSFFVIADSNGNVVDAQNAIGDQTKHTYTVTSTTVENSKGVELPSTGGEGTVTMITVGTLLAIGFAVFLITHKKMSVYTD